MYESYLVSTEPLEGVKVALDTATGAASTSARQILQTLRPPTVTHQMILTLTSMLVYTPRSPSSGQRKAVLLLFGLIETDRLIAIDENGDIVDGDRL